VQFPKGSDEWYILRCEEHALSFKDNPIMGAAAHLGSTKHGQMSRAYAVVIKHLGVQVLDCDKNAADKNNIVARKAFLSRDEHPATNEAEKQSEQDPAIAPMASLPPKQTRRIQQQLHRAPRATGGRSKVEDADGIVEPIRGQVYLGFWEMSKQWSAVLLLPTANLDHVGVPGTIEDLGLAKMVPSCYSYSQRTKKFSWRADYEVGGRLASQREFPVMYFDGLPFPAKSTVGWVAAKNLRAFDPYDPSSSLIPNIRAVRKFITEREKKPRQSQTRQTRQRQRQKGSAVKKMVRRMLL
jgi:hypothetical protein